MKPARHTLLERQLRKATAEGGAVDWAAFVALIEQAYREAERESALRDRALRLMSDEMFALGQNVAVKAEARFRIVPDRPIEGVAITDAAGMIRTANQAFADMAGTEPGALGGRAIWPLFPALAHLDAGSAEGGQGTRSAGSIPSCARSMARSRRLWAPSTSSAETLSANASGRSTTSPPAAGARSRPPKRPRPRRSSSTTWRKG